jgi:protein-tyrosine-phosphatase
MDHPLNILFVCTGNTCRSVLAHAFMKKILEEASGKNIQVNVFSAGVAAAAGLVASGEALKVLSNHGIDFSEHRSSPVTPELVEQAHYIFTMTPDQKNHLLDSYPGAGEKIWLLKEYAGGREETVSDPFGRGIAAYRQAAAEIGEALQEIVAKWERLRGKKEK